MDTENSATNEPLIVEEYATITLRLDHLQSDEANEGHVILPAFQSTRELTDDVVALLQVHGQEHFLRHREVRALLASVEGKKAAVFFVADPNRSYMVVDSGLYDLFLADPIQGGSRLATDSSLIALAREMREAAPRDEEGNQRKFWAYVAND